MKLLELMLPRRSFLIMQYKEMQEQSYQQEQEEVAVI